MSPGLVELEVAGPGSVNLGLEHLRSFVTPGEELLSPRSQPVTSVSTLRYVDPTPSIHISGFLAHSQNVASLVHDALWKNLTVQRTKKVGL